MMTKKMHISIAYMMSFILKMMLMIFLRALYLCDVKLLSINCGCSGHPEYGCWRCVFLPGRIPGRHKLLLLLYLPNRSLIPDFISMTIWEIPVWCTVRLCLPVAVPRPLILTSAGGTKFLTVQKRHSFWSGIYIRSATISWLWSGACDKPWGTLKATRSLLSNCQGLSASTAST